MLYVKIKQTPKHDMDGHVNKLLVKAEAKLGYVLQ